jgi:hypothetical protein
MSRVFIGNSTTLQTWKQAYNSLDSDVGDTTLLHTVDKSHIVNALNEQNYRIDSIDGLLDQAVMQTSDVIFNSLQVRDSGATHYIDGNLVLQKDLTVGGVINFVNSNQIDIGDNIVVLNAGVTGTPIQNSGIEVERGTSLNAELLWNEAGDYWTASYNGVGNTGRIITNGDTGILINQNIALSTIANNKLVNPYITFKDAANNTSNIALGSTVQHNGTIDQMSVDYDATTGVYTTSFPSYIEVPGDMAVYNNFSVGGNFTIVGNSLHASPLIKIMSGNIQPGLGVNVERRAGLHIDRGSLDNVLFVYDETVDQFVWYDSDPLGTLPADRQTVLTTHNTIGTINEVEVTYTQAGTTIGLPNSISVTNDVTVGSTLNNTTHLSASNYTSGITGNYGLTASGTTTITSGGSYTANVTGNASVNSTTGIFIAASNGNATIDVSGDIILDADNGRVTVKDKGITTLDIVSNGITDVLFDAPGDIILDADGANVTLKDNGVTALDILWNGTAATSVVTLDAPGYISLDADGGQIRMLDNGVEFARFTKSGNGVKFQGGNDKSYLTMIDSGFVIEGDLIVKGTTVTTQVSEVSTNDNIITLNADVTTIPTENAGIEVERGTAVNATMQWNETADYWQATNDNIGTVGRVITSADVGTVTSSMFASGAITGGSLTGGYIEFNTVKYNLASAYILSADNIVDGTTNRFFTSALSRASINAYAHPTNLANAIVNTTTDATNSTANAYLKYDGGTGELTLYNNPAPTATGVLSISADRQISHNAKPATAVSINGSNGNVIQDISIDAYGHINGAIGTTDLDTRYLRLDASTIKTTGDLTFNDSRKMKFGTDADMHMWHNGTNGYIDLIVGDLYIRNSTTNKFTFDRSGGNFTAAGDVTAYSDERLKTNIRTIDNAIDKVSALRGVYFDKDDKASTGVIAQEIEKVLPEVVNNDGEYKSVAYGNIVGVLIEAIKELKAEIDILKNK